MGWEVWRLRRVGALVVLVVAAASEIGVAAEKNAALAAARTITAGELKRHVNVLADDTFEGREGGSRGGRAAGGYLAEQFENLGLKPQGDRGSYFQAFPGNQRNILGLFEGSDPALKQQIVIVGAHYDHVGYGSRGNSYGPTGQIHNGADDNASGVSGLLEVAQAFAALPERPKRSVLFALWDGEEKGLLGSKHWLANPTTPLKNVVLAVNMDMIGRLRKSRLEVYGTRTSAGLRSLVSGQNQETGLWLDFTWEMKENSDHYPFFERNIPSLMFHTGLHDNYHRPSDDTHLINNEGIETVARLVFGVALAVSDGDQPYKFRNESRREDPAARRAFEQPLDPPQPRLGVEWISPPGGEPGVVIVKVTPGLAAAEAGIKGGDRLLTFAGKDIKDDAQLRGAVLAASAPAEVTLVREGAKEPLTIAVPLRGSPVRLGIAWREDPSEPGTVFLTQVVYGSPAHRAGLRERDRIYEIGGKKFASGEQLRQLATTLASPVEILAERSGVLHRYQVELSE